MGTSALIAQTLDGIRWTGVWHHIDSGPTVLGAWLVRRGTALSGNLGVLADEVVVQPGWSYLPSHKFLDDDDELWVGTYNPDSGLIVDGTLEPDEELRKCSAGVNFIYLIDVPRRAIVLFAAESSRRELSSIVFDDLGRPNKAGF